jgi:hypothetical protein
VSILPAREKGVCCLVSGGLAGEPHPWPLAPIYHPHASGRLRLEHNSCTTPTQKALQGIRSTCRMPNGRFDFVQKQPCRRFHTNHAQHTAPSATNSPPQSDRVTSNGGAMDSAAPHTQTVYRPELNGSRLGSMPCQCRCHCQYRCHCPPTTPFDQSRLGRQSDAVEYRLRSCVPSRPRPTLQPRASGRSARSYALGLGPATRKIGQPLGFKRCAPCATLCHPVRLYGPGSCHVLRWHVPSAATRRASP